MPQLNPDEAATDEPKTYNDEAIGGDDSNDLSDIKGDLVDEDDTDPIHQSYENKNSAIKNGRTKHGFDGDGQNEITSGRAHFSYSQHDMDSFVSGFGHPMLQNAFLPTSAQVPYSHYMNPYMGSLLCRPSPPLDREKSQVPGLPRIPYSDVPAMLPLPGQLGQIPHPLSPWSPTPLHPLCTSAVAAGMLRYPYPFHNFSSSGGMGAITPFPLLPPPGNGIRPNMMHHPSNLPGAPHLNGHQDYGKPSVEKKNSNSKRTKKNEKLNRPYVKKPLNAFMIYMKEQRAKVVAECTLKESAAINQILGRKWHSLDREEQQKYYEIARKERQLHMQLHPSWSARDNYGKRKKRKKEKPQDCSSQSAKKCRAVFGLDQQNSWCAPCRRKKKCIRYHHEGEDSDDSDASRNEDGEDKISFSDSGQSKSCENTAPHISQSSFSSNSSGQSRGDAVARSLPSSQSELSIPVKQEKSPLQCEADQKEHQQRLVASGCATTVINSQSGSTSIINGTPRQHVPGPPTGQFEDNLRALASSLAPPNPPPSADSRPLRMSSNSDASLTSNSSGGSRSTLYNSPLLSPSASSINSPHSNPPIISYFAAAAGLPASSPLGGLMGFSNLHGLASPIHMGLNGSASPVSHVTSNGSRLTSSAVEGKS